MAAKKQQTRKREAQQKRQETKSKGQEEQRPKTLPYAAAAVIIAAAAIIIAYLLFSSSGAGYSGTPFPTFKSNLNSAGRIAVLLGYANTTQLGSEIQCSNYVIEVLSNARNPSTIDFMETNQTTCVYSPNGLGHSVNPVTTNASACLDKAQAEPSLVFNYTSTNTSVITPDHMYISGNAAYYAKCPIAIDLT